MTKLLTSVRNLTEAKLALDAGTDWLDLKEPRMGALGAVPLEVVSEVVDWSNVHQAQVPVSATIGDCWETPELIPERVAEMSDTGVDFVKVGIFADRFSSETALAIKSSVGLSARLIVLCFAETPPTNEHIQAIANLGASGLMLDTAKKQEGRLTDKMSISDISKFVRAVKARRCLCGLAGSLKLDDIDTLVRCGADYLGFRGALCDKHKRNGDLSSALVARVKSSLRQSNSTQSSDTVESSQRNI